jgi:glycosyltransferase involved in cell wall biosynthesis
VLVYFVNHSTAPVNLGGAERSMITFVEDWMSVDPDFEPFFLTKAPRGRFIDAIEQRGWNYLAIKFRGWALPDVRQSPSQAAYFARDDYDATLRMIGAMEGRRPDLVVTNTVVAPWGAFAAKVLGIPHAWFIREYGDLDHGLVFQLGREATLRDIGTLSEAVFVNSLALKEHVEPFIDEAKLDVVYPRVELSAIQIQSLQPPATTPFTSPDAGALRVVMVGRLSDSKGQSQVIEALGLLQQRQIKVELCLVGASEPAGFERQLRALAKSLGVVENVTFAGEQANPFPYIAAADVCVTASDIEAFGRTTLEYLSFGKPVIASASGGSAELVEDGTSGFLYPPRDTAALASALERYARDSELIATHGRAASKRAMKIMATPFTNRAAIARLTAVAAQPASRLPNAARYWFGLPRVMIAGQNSGARITVGFLAHRALRLVRRTMRLK